MGNIEFPFIGGAYTARDTNLNAQVCQNYYLSIDDTGAKTVLALLGSPGGKLFKDLSVTAEGRALTAYKGHLYAVFGNTVYKLDSAKAKTSIGTVGTSEGFVDITDDGANLTLYDATGGWVWDDTTFTQITDPAFPVPSGATLQDGLQIISKSGTGEFYISTADDPTEWDALQFATAEGDGDILVSPVSVERQLWLIGKKTTEIWFNSGATFTFDRNPGGFTAIGCNSKRSIARYKNDLLFLNDTNQVVRNQGWDLAPVSTYQIDLLIGRMTRTDNSVGFAYFQEGHVFYELTFPTDSVTICYDLTTGFWSTRASGADDKRSRANCTVRFDNKVLVGDFENGKIYEYDLATYDDDGIVKRAIRTGQPLNTNNQMMFIGSLELDMETGNGGEIALQSSKDGAKTWNPERVKSMGAIGEYGTLMRWDQFGASRDFTFRTIISDAVPRNIYSAYLRGETSDA